MQFIVDRAVANGPVDLTVTGPIIEPVIKTFFLAGFGRNNNADGIFVFDIVFATTQSTYAHPNDSICTQYMSIPYGKQAVIIIRWVGEAPRCTRSLLASTASLKPMQGLSRR